MGIEETYLNIIKAIYDIPTANIILSGEKLKSFPSQIRNKRRMPSHTTSIQHNWKSKLINQARKTKGIQIRKKAVKLLLFADCMILYIENPKESITIRTNKSENEVTQSCPTLCNPMDYSLPGFSVHGIF